MLELTVIAPVPELMAKMESVLPLSMAQVRPVVSPVVDTVTTAASFEAVSAIEADVSVTVGAVSVIVMVIDSVSGVTPSVT